MASSDSGQKFIKRNRPPRVQISYEDPYDAEKLVELPFVMGIMADLSAVRPERSVALDFEEADIEIALVRWLNLLLGLSHEQGLVFSRFWIERDGVLWRGGASGEPWRRDLERGVEVKGATLTMLEVEQGPDGWRARCVVDV